MNILIDGRNWSRNGAGITTFLCSALTEWARQWHEDHFYVILPKGMDPSVEIASIPPNLQKLDYSGRFPRRLPNIAILQLLAPWLCRKLKIDLYYSPVPHLPWGLPKRVRTLITVHDVVNLEMAHTMAWTNRLATFFFFAPSIRKSNFLWANSHYTEQKVRQYFPKRNCLELFVGDAADNAYFHPQQPTRTEQISLKKDLGISTDRFVLFVGSLEPRKNLAFLLSIAPDLYRLHGLQLVVVGGKKWKTSSIANIVNAPSFPRESTVFCGHVTNRELALLYSMASCFVSAALMEGFGMPQLEALKCGCPVVTAHNTAMIEIAEGKAGAVTVEGYNPEDWIKTIVQMVEKRPVVVQTELEEYDWGKIIRRLSQYINENCVTTI